GQLKAVLRELARRVLGERVARGKKRGFGVPAERWMLGAWRSKVDDAFRHPVLAEHGWVRSHELRRAWERAVAAGVVPQQLWYVYVLELWARHDLGAAREVSPSAPLAVAV